VHSYPVSSAVCELHTLDRFQKVNRRGLGLNLRKHQSFAGKDLAGRENEAADP